MKTALIALFTVFLTLAAQANDGVHFVDGAYDQVVRQAKNQKKLLLLDFTAAWCLPCKEMDREVFPDADLGAFVNETFVSFKVKADKSAGKAIARDFGVGAYPTILIVDNRGMVVKRIIGYRTADYLLDELRPLGDFQSLFEQAE